MRERVRERAREPEPARPAAPGAADLLALQRGAGNQAVVRRVEGGQAVLQRKPAGLREATATTAYTKDALDYWQDPANASKSLQQLAEHLIAKANDALKALGVWQMQRKFDSALKTPGEFDPTTWTIGLNTDLFVEGKTVAEVSKLTAAEASKIAGMIYHEARHAEQHFQIARMVAGASTQTGTALVNEIVTATQIPVDPAKAAAGVPLAKSAPNARRLAEAQDWQAVTAGRHKRYKDIVVAWELEVRSATNIGFDALRGDQARAKVRQFLAFWHGPSRLKVITDHIRAVKALPKTTSLDTVVLANLKAIEAQMAKVDAAWNKLETDAAKLGPKQLLDRFTAFEKTALGRLIDVLHNAYLALPHEQDAWAAGGAVEKQFIAGAKPPRPQQAKRAGKLTPQPQPQ